MEKIKIGIIGCGTISSIYLKNCTQIFNNLEVVACADIMPEKAETRAAEFNIPRAYTVDELLADPDIEAVVNLTIPKVHAEVNMKALQAGKHVYCEKPLATNREDAKKVLELAKSKSLKVGCAPDTFLSGTLQTCRKLIDEGWIGNPIAATAFMMGHKPETWHPDPEFLYKPGSGPMFDMGPYYLTALVSLLGPVSQVCAAAKTSFTERKITSAPKYGQKIAVEVPTYVSGLMNFESGAIGSLITTFDIVDSRLPNIEIYGSTGTLIVPDPNNFGGSIWLKRQEHSDWKEVPLVYGFTENSRGLGLSDMANAILTGGNHRASGDLAYHVLDIMQGFHEAAEDGRFYNLESSCTKPVLLPLNN